MNLSRYGREFYRVSVTTTPAVTAWEASFDNGTTWVDGEDFTDPDAGAAYRWLVAGPDAALGDAVAVIEASVTPLLRDVDTSEIIVRDAPRIWLD